MKDYLVDEDLDLQVTNGDFVAGESNQQHVEAILINQKGEYKQYPLLGFGVVNYLKSDTSEVKFKRDLKIQLEYDGFSDATIDLSEGFENLKIEI